jgi:hypothetical protein
MNAEGGPKNECSEKYYQFGPAYEDIVQFAADESLWLRKFLEAWHMATENGYNNTLTYIVWSRIDRTNLPAGHDTVCRGLN